MVWLFSDQRPSRGFLLSVISSCRYLGANWLRILNTGTAILKYILASTGNQCSSISTGVVELLGVCDAPRWTMLYHLKVFQNIFGNAEKYTIIIV